VRRPLIVRPVTESGGAATAPAGAFSGDILLVSSMYNLKRSLNQLAANESGTFG
jgi:hypothetical protein